MKAMSPQIFNRVAEASPLVCPGGAGTPHGVAGQGGQVLGLTETCPLGGVRALGRTYVNVS